MTTCTLDEPYISIYDKPKRPRGRPKVLTDEQIKERNRLIYKKNIMTIIEIIMCLSNVFITN